MTYKERQKRYIELTDTALKEYLALSSVPELLSASMSYSVDAGGKRLRPCLVLASCELIGGKIETALPFACAIEFIHTYSLIHDDLPAMDDDDLRRGKPSNHKVFGEGQAILAGDGLLTYAFEILLSEILKNSDSHYVKAALAVAQGAGITGMVAGQVLDLQNEAALLHAQSGMADKLCEIHRRKTGALIKACVEAGAYCANANEEQLSALCCFAEQYGLLFQITDDILDVTGDAAELGKATGKDTNKLTFPSVFGLEGAKEQANDAAEKAKQSLTTFADDAWFFRELIEYTLIRKS